MSMTSVSAVIVGVGTGVNGVAVGGTVTNKIP